MPVRLAGEQLDQLFFATGGVFGGHHPHLDVAALAGPLDGGDGVRLVVFDAANSSSRGVVMGAFSTICYGKRFFAWA